MRRIKNVALVLENEEIIALRKNEIKDLCIDGIVPTVVKIAQDIIEIDAAVTLGLTLYSRSNHTYNSFGSASRKPIFDRLMETPDPIAMLSLQYEDGSVREIFLPDYVRQEITCDEFGDLQIICCEEEEPEDESEFGCDLRWDMGEE